MSRGFRASVVVACALAATGCEGGAAPPGDAVVGDASVRDGPVVDARMPDDVQAAVDAPTPSDVPSAADATSELPPPGDAPAVSDVPVPVDALADVAVADAPSPTDVPADLPAPVDAPPPVDAPATSDVPAPPDAPPPMDAGTCMLSSPSSGARPLTTRVYGTTSNLGGVDVAVMPCDVHVGTTFATADTLRARYLLGRRYWFRFSLAGHVSGNTDEFGVTGDGLGFSPLSAVEMIPTGSVRSVFPGFDATKAHVLLSTRGEGTTCVPPASGVTVRVVGHPEARVVYWVGASPSPGATSLERFGRASIENLTPGEPAEIVTEGGNCVLATVLGAAHSGRHPLVANTVTFASTRTVAAPADAGSADAAATDAASSDASSCGADTVTLGGTPIVVWPPISRPLGGVSVSWIGCGAPQSTTNASGLWSLSVARSMPGYLRSTREGALPTLTGELSVPTTAPLPAYLWESSATAPVSAAWLPGYDPARAHVFIDINDATGGCARTGFVPTIPGHPEAVVRYVGSAAGVDGSLTSTNSYGRIVVTGLTPGGYVSPTATNGTCRLNFARVLQTGRVRLEAGSVTVLQSRAEP